MTALERLLYRELYKKSFYDFVKAFWHTCDPAKFIDGKLIKCYCEIAQYMCRAWTGYEEVEIDLPTRSDDIEIIDVRQSKNNICIAVPPRHTKSKIFNVFLPVWLWTNYPIKAVSISHTGALASEMNTQRYNIVNSELFRELYPEIYLVTNKKDRITDNRGGELYSQNRDAMTGYGGDVVINDDLTNAETARKNQAEMGNAWSYYQNTMPSRINDPDKCIVMNIQQRLAPNDIMGHIMNDPKLSSMYVFVTLPAIFSRDTYIVCPISGEVVEYKKGESLWAERFGNYEAIKNQVGDAIFETQYLQNPIASDKTVIKPEMIIEKPECDCPDIDRADIVYASHDFPVKDKETSDYLGSVLGYRIGATLYIIDCLEKHMEFVKSVDYVERLEDIYPGIIQVIEDKANGSPILQQLQDRTAGLQAYNPGANSKTQRLESASIYMNSKNVVFVQAYDEQTKTYHLSPALQNLKMRLLNFPFVEHDDIVDAFSMLVLFVFMDRRYMVYGRAFNEENLTDGLAASAYYSTVFFNREGDIWKMAEIVVDYGKETHLIVRKEYRFKGDVKDGIATLRKFAPDKSVFIDCSAVSTLNAMYEGVSIEYYAPSDFDASVAMLNLAFGKKAVLIDRRCGGVKADIESFKFAKMKTEEMKYTTEKDGFVACIRTALKYYGGIV